MLKSCVRVILPLAVFAVPDKSIAQGITTAGIRGIVTTADGTTVSSARVRVTNSATGFTTEVDARDGRYLLQGLEPGGPYTVGVRAVGFNAVSVDNVTLALGELRRIDFAVERLIAELEPTTVVARATNGGTGLTIGPHVLNAMPTLNRDFYDFVRFVPQISTKISLSNPGFSAAGTGFRFNNFLINGVSERTLGGNVSAAFSGARSVPIDAVQEYQVLLSPYDAGYGDFAGALVNAITKSGTNSFRGSAFVSGRNEQFTRRPESSGAVPYDRVQAGFSAGGPLIRDRLHFFISPEVQHFTFPASGPYEGQAPDATPAVPVSASDLARLTQAMRAHGLEAGSAGPVTNSSPLRNLFSRLDLALPSLKSRVVAWNNLGMSDERAFSRARPDTFSLSSTLLTRVSRTSLSAIHIHTAMQRKGGGHNELLLSTQRGSLDGVPEVRQPLVRVATTSVSGGGVTINTGTPENAQGGDVSSSAITVRDVVTLPLGVEHVLTAGVEAERFRIKRMGVTGSYGAWTFASIGDLERGVADGYDVGLDFGATAAPLEGEQVAAYLNDRWQVGSRLSVTTGIRADMLSLDRHAPYQSGVDSIFSRRTDEMPRRRVELSPRVGFVWEPGQRGQTLRGGVGIFATRFPLAWAHTALMSYGSGSGLLRCGRTPIALGFAPPFSPDYRSPPLACANGARVSSARRGDVNLLDRNLRMMRVARGSLAYDGTLPSEIRMTTEVLVSHSLSDFVFVNLNLPDSVSSDRNGRAMYGFIDQLGVGVPAARSGFSEVIELRSHSHSRSQQISVRFEKSVEDRLSATLAYTLSRARDAMTPTRVNTRGTVAWASARVLSGRQDRFDVGVSSNDVPHRVVFTGSVASPSLRWKSEMAIYYIGESGRPFTYVAFGTRRRGDLNADGSNANDPIYVPTNALDTTEIRFNGDAEAVASQQTSFESLIRRTDCLRRQRGKIVARNTCREPWSNTTAASLRQRIPVGKRGIEAQIDVFNALNLLNERWGKRREAAPGLLEHVEQTTTSAGASRSVFHFDPSTPRFTVLTEESAFQLQLAVRYRF